MQRTILVVDDDPNVLIVTSALLKHFGYQVLKADGGQNAIQAWQHHQSPIDLLYTDVFMPGMNGIELAAALTALQPGLKVLYTSGAGREEVDALFANPEEIRLIKKPPQIEHLAECVREAIAGE